MKSKIRKRRRLRSSANKGLRRRRSSSSRSRVLIGGAHDPSEKAADKASEQVMKGKRAAPLSPASAAVHRACAECEEKSDKDKKVKRSAQGAPSVAPGTKAAHAGDSASSAIHSMGPGKALSRAERAYFEPRFGRDFSSVRVHDDPSADRAARSIDARAFAWGADIAFASGERERGGAHLLSHELAHVAAGGEGTAQRMLHRATIATADGAKSYKKVPDNQRATVTQALALIERAIKGKRCQDFFKSKCSAGAADTAKKNFDSATVYYLTDKSTTFGVSDVRASGADPSIIAYNQLAYDIGRWEVASTLLHELFHTCDFSVDDMDEILAEKATEACAFYAPWLLDAGPSQAHVNDMVSVKGYQLGQAQDGDHFLELGGTKIASYDKWEQARGQSSVAIQFKVPEALGYTMTGPEKLDLVAVSHGFRSNSKPIKVAP